MWLKTGDNCDEFQHKLREYEAENRFSLIVVNPVALHETIEMSFRL